jgi:hypothetical protein
MPNFDAVIGADETAANKTLASIFKNAPGLFARQIPVNKQGLGTIEVMINQTPVLSFSPTPLLHDEVASHVDQMKLQDPKGTLAALLSSAVTLTCPMVVMFDLSTGQGGEASIVCDGVFTAAPANQGSNASFMMLTISRAVITVVDNPALSTLYNTVFVPYLISYFNEYVLPIVRIPASYAIGGITLSAPTVGIEGGFLTGLTALGSVSPQPSALALTAGKTSVGLDAALINAVITANVPQQTFGDSGGIPTPNFSWDYHVEVTPQSVQLMDGEIQVSVGITGGVNFTFHTPGALPNVSFSGGLSGSCTANATILTQPNGNGTNVLFHLSHVGGYSIQPSIDHLPSFLNDLIGDVLGPLASAVGNTIGNNIDESFHTLFTIPPAPIATSFQGGANLVLQDTSITINPSLLLLQADLIAVPRAIAAKSAEAGD